MLALVSSGVGVALIPTAAARLQLRGVVLRTMQTEPPEPVQTICAYRRDNDNPILDVFRSDILPAFVQNLIPKQRSNS
jgi:DNA-binding transcriptional LysR family regulator